MDHIGVFSGDYALDQHCHVDLAETETDLASGKEGSLIELACPHVLDLLPALIEVFF